MDMMRCEISSSLRVLNNANNRCEQKTVTLESQSDNIQDELLLQNCYNLNFWQRKFTEYSSVNHCAKRSYKGFTIQCLHSETISTGSHKEKFFNLNFQQLHWAFTFSNLLWL